MSGYPEYHSFKVQSQTFVIHKRYSLIKVIGHGAYGVVISAQDQSTGDKYAIKKIAKTFENNEDAKRILREIILMRRLNHENIIRMLDLIPPHQDATDFEEIYIVQDLMETDLHRIIYSKQSLSVDHAKYFIYQIIRGLKYLHSANVIHRDLKPGNLLVKSDCSLKICDFGLSRVMEEDSEGSIYVVTRWYRSPEILLNCRNYGGAIDMWSVGCILAELLLRKPLLPGDDYITQIKLIHNILGTQLPEDLEHVTSERARKFIMGLPRKAYVGMASIIPECRNNTDCLDLLEKLLCFNPDKRISVKNALEHPFLAANRAPSTEIVADFTYDDAFSFENMDPEALDKETIQSLMWEQLRSLHPYIPSRHP